MLIGVIADDLTGAADAVAPFALRRIPSVVGWEIKHSAERFPLAEGDATAYDTETRDLPREAEREIVLAVRRAARRLMARQPTLIFKKIDSTLRGHLRLELAALREDLPGRLALICPAFPANGRTVHSGILHIDGTAWTITDFAPAYPLDPPTIAGAFGMARDLGVAELSGTAIRAGAESVEATLERMSASGIHTVFCDAADDRHLGVLAQVLLRKPAAYLPVGSAGWTHAIALVHRGPVTPAIATRRGMPPRTLVVAGSLHRATRQQLNAMAAGIGASAIALDPAVPPRQSVDRAVDALWAQFRAGQSAALLTTPDLLCADHDERSWQIGSVARRLCERALRAGQPIQRLVATGGYTAMEVCRAMHGLGLTIQGETQPGIVTALLRADSDPIDGLSFDGLPVVVKAGGFGDERTLLRCAGLI